jgi:hypothetical protein
LELVGIGIAVGVDKEVAGILDSIGVALGHLQMEVVAAVGMVVHRPQQEVAVLAAT